MASLRRLGEDAVGLGAAGIVIGTTLEALHAPFLLILLCAILPLLTRMRFRVMLAAALLVSCCLAGMRGTGEAAKVDPLRGIRDRILLPLVAAVPGDAGALAAGLTLGDARYFTPGLKDAMRQSATTHLVALSGFNVAIIVGGLRRAIRGRMRRKREVALCIAVLAGFVLLAGFQPSLVRAALMGSALLLAGLWGRRLAPGRLLLVTAAAMLLAEPAWATSLGFLLSFISSWALLATVGDVERMLVSGIGLRKLGSLVAPSLAAQAGVAPALLASVGSVMLVGLFVNPVLVPLTPIVTAVAGSELLLAHLAPGLADLLSPLASLATWPVTAGIGLAAKLPLQAAFALPAWTAVVLYTAWVGYALVRKPELW